MKRPSLSVKFQIFYLSNKIICQHHSKVIQLISFEMRVHKGLLIFMNWNSANNFLGSLFNAIHIRIVLLEVLCELIDIGKVVAAGISLAARALWYLLAHCLVGRQLHTCLLLVFLDLVLLLLWDLLVVGPFFQHCAYLFFELVDLLLYSYLRLLLVFLSFTNLIVLNFVYLVTYLAVVKHV